ncbi:MAG: D-lactate dehydrogenase, partial [Pseudomonadota bacterium]
YLSAGLGPDSDWFACTKREGKIAGLHRFAAAGAAVRYQAVHDTVVEDIIPLDIALRRNDRDWFEVLPSEIEGAFLAKLYYGHFFCHVLHQDYIVKKGHAPKAIKAKLLSLLDARGAKYPAEHNVGHLYKASDAQAAFFRDCDPTNAFNPGIGATSRRKDYA